MNKKIPWLNKRDLTGQAKIKFAAFGYAFVVFGLFVGVLGFGGSARAADYYMPDNCANLQACFGLMSSGDELIIRDGTYTGEANMISNTNRPPDGTNESYTVIKAEHDGGAIFDGEYSYNPVRIYGGASYLYIRGLVFKHSLVNGGLFYIQAANHVKVIRCGGVDMGTTTDAIFYFGTGSTYSLFEGCYAWGHTRYSFMIYESDYCIVRRCIARIDRSIATPPRGLFRNYGHGDADSSNNEWQNNIAIDTDTRDSDVGSDDGVCWQNMIGDGAFFYGAFYADSNSPDVAWRGNIVLNVKAPAHWTNEASSGQIIENSVYWDNFGGLYIQDGGNNPVIVDHLTVSSNSAESEATVNYGLGIGYTYINPTGTVTNSIIFSNSWRGFNSGSTSLTSDYNCVNGNALDYSGVSPGLNDVTYNPLSNGLDYLVRVEDSSNLKSDSSDSEGIGANIVYMYGVDNGESERISGLLYGESGYNTLTNDSLWPFPHEDQIKTDMAAYSYDSGGCTVNGARGFCSSGTGLYGGDITLTSYIWEYLGNSCPNDICDYGGDTTPPSRSNPQPTGTLTSGTTSTTISLTTDETATCKYSITANTDYNDMTLQLSSGQANAHTATVSNLEDGNSYTYYIRCQDESNNQNTDDFEISFSVASSQTYSISNFINLVTDWLKTESGLESDVNGDRVVNTRDLGIMMSNWQ